MAEIAVMALTLLPSFEQPLLCSHPLSGVDSKQHCNIPNDGVRVQILTFETLVSSKQGAPFNESDWGRVESDTEAFPRAVQQLKSLPRVDIPYDSHVTSFLRH